MYGVQIILANARRPSQLVTMAIPCQDGDPNRTPEFKGAISVNGSFEFVG
jgi:hypothetical protein